ncbi:EamA family transporter [Streptomyces sp. NPDC005970]|uniref:EamA family transporter n=1 Tax=Streptomyces sp. NPDC005970 TaxID=3156723 RepID=UPI0033D3B6B9
MEPPCDAHRLPVESHPGPEGAGAQRGRRGLPRGPSHRRIVTPGARTGRGPTGPVGSALAAGCGTPRGSRSPRSRGCCYAAYSLIGGRLILRGHPSGVVMGAMFGAAGLLVLPVLLAAGTAWLATVRGAAVALHLGVFPTFLAYRLFGHGLRHTPAAVATTLSLAEAAVAALLGVTFVGERLPVVSWCGLAVLALGLALLAAPNRAGRRRT